jgi:hypothetical protein
VRVLCAEYGRQSSFRIELTTVPLLTKMDLLGPVLNFSLSGIRPTTLMALARWAGMVSRDAPCGRPEKWYLATSLAASVAELTRQGFAEYRLWH